MSSNRIAKVRPVRLSAPVFVDTGRRCGVSPEGPDENWTASKLAMVCGTPSSASVKSSAFKPVTGLPFLSVTTTSTGHLLHLGRKAGHAVLSRGALRGAGDS
jgi:hypothetical protein